MNIGLIDVDGHNFPNLPQMKISAYHKAQGDTVEKLVELLEEPIEIMPGRFGSPIFKIKLPYAEVIADRMIANGVTVQEWISVEAGELQNYIGVPVCIKRKTDGECWWAIIRGIKGDKVSTDYGGYFKLSEYGETWMVKYLPLPQPPKGEISQKNEKDNMEKEKNYE